MAERDKALDDPTERYWYRLLRLNLGPLAGAGIIPTLVDVDDWERCLTPDPVEVLAPAIWGVDLGANRSLSSVVAIDGDGVVGHLAVAGQPPDLPQRDREAGADGVLLAALDSGELVVVADKYPKPETVLSLAFDRWGPPSLVVADSYRQGALADALAADGMGSLLRVEQSAAHHVEAVVALRRVTSEHALTVPARLRLLTASLGWAKMHTGRTGDPMMDRRSSRAVRGGTRRSG